MEYFLGFGDAPVATRSRGSVSRKLDSREIHVSSTNHMELS